MTSTLILLSGGLDSSTLLAQTVAEGRAGLALSVFYGQRHGREIDAARSVARYYGLKHEVLDLSGWGALLRGSASALIDQSVPVPHGHYAAPMMTATIVPNRNATLLCAAAGIAISCELDTVATAVHAGDHPVYPDCRPEFIAALNTAIGLGTDAKVTIDAPYSQIDKTDIARLAGALDVPIELTWSCYEGGERHCGRCGTCVERRECLDLAGVPDPTAYAA